MMRTTPTRSRKVQDARKQSWYQKEVLRLLAAVAVIGAVLSLNLVFPETAAQLRERCASLIMTNTDLEESLSDLGEMLSDGDLPGAVEEWCIAVFAPAEEETKETPDNSSADAAGEPELPADGTLSEA